MMKRWNYFLAILAAGMIMTAGIGQAMAYFTTYAETGGGHTVRIGDDTKITEEFSDWEKILIVENKEGSEPVFVRARAFVGAPYTLEYTGENWTYSEADGYYYYGGPVSFETGEEGRPICLGGIAVPGSGSQEERSTKALNVQIRDIPEDVIEGDTFDVVVIYESTPVRYMEDGTPYADWTVRLDPKEEAAPKPQIPAEGGDHEIEGTEEAEDKTDHEAGNERPEESKEGVSE